MTYCYPVWLLINVSYLLSWLFWFIHRYMLCCFILCSSRIKFLFSGYLKNGLRFLHVAQNKIYLSCMLYRWSIISIVDLTPLKRRLFINSIWFSFLINLFFILCITHCVITSWAGNSFFKITSYLLTILTRFFYISLLN